MLLKIIKTPNESTNSVYTKNINGHVMIKKTIYTCKAIKNIPEESIMLTVNQMLFLNVSVGDSIKIEKVETPEILDVIQINVSGTNNNSLVYNKLFQACTGDVFSNKQQILFTHQAIKFTVIVFCEKSGILAKTTKFQLIEDGIFGNGNNELIDPVALGIGGLHKEFSELFRRAFLFRLFQPGLIKKLGQQYVKGIILYGPPGTGKTLIARKIAKLISRTKPKVISAPEVYNKYLGSSEENIRKLFTASESGAANALYVIIIDEIDAICRHRGNSSIGGVGDSIVNQLLAKMDGVSEKNNFLIIGMTNRLDVIDPALLRPGRFEVQIKINLPDKFGRKEIFQIHTKSMRENGFLQLNDEELNNLIDRTQNFSGAEIAGLVRNAVSYSLNNSIPIEKQLMKEFLKKAREFNCPKITYEHFNSALENSHARMSTDYPVIPILGKIKLMNYDEICDEAKKYDFIKIISPLDIMKHNINLKNQILIQAYQDCQENENSVLVLKDVDILFLELKTTILTLFTSSQLIFMSVSCDTEKKYFESFI